MNDYRETLEWYRTHQTTREIGFNPDGMCLAVCRTARDIGAYYPSATAAQDATPYKYRVHRVRDLRRGMVLYFDEPNDSNRFGHIVTMIGRVKGFNWDDMNDVLVETNDVKSGELVVVRGTYFKQYWGDDFQFGATYLNGMVLDIPEPKTRVQKFHKSGPNYNVKLLDKAVDEGRRDVKDEVRGFDKAVDSLPDDGHKSRVTWFKSYYKEHRVLKMPLLNHAVANGRVDNVKEVRDEIRRLIKSLPDK